MTEFRFSLIVPVHLVSHEEILDAADKLAEFGCLHASVRGHSDGMELIFERKSDSLQSAISSAINDVEHAGQRVVRVEMEREAILS